MAVGTQAEQRAYLRRMVGHESDTALVSDSLLDDCLGRGLRDINQSFALWGFGSFSTVISQQEYVPIPATGYALTKVFWPASCEYELPRSVDSSVNQLIISEVVDEYGARRTIEPSIVAAWYQNQEFFYRLYGQGGYIRNETTVFLDPVPELVTTVYFNFTKERYASVEDVEDLLVEPYFASCLSALHEALSVGRGALHLGRVRWRREDDDRCC